MPTFTVPCRFDAYADNVAGVEADSAEDAAQWRTKATKTKSGVCGLRGQEQCCTRGRLLSR
jgi:hypothetical protein